MKYPIFVTNIEKETLKNNYFRKVINTTSKLQLVLMTIQPMDNIPREKHIKHDQFIRIESGKGKAVITDKYEKILETHILSDGICIIIPANNWHEIINTSKTNELKLYSIYTPPEHPPNKINKIKP
jgi:mannose-6-phosphate isomerase-like protein (cupin superfamily)